MGNCLNENKTHLRSSLTHCPRLEILEIDSRDTLITNKMDKSLLLSCVQIIKEDPETEQDADSSFKLDSNFHIECSGTTSIFRLQQGVKVESHHQVKFFNLHTQRYLHSHIVKHEHSKLNEVSTCNNCNYQYDWWQIKLIDNRSYVFHPLTNSYLKCSNTGCEMREVGCHQSEMDEWELITDNEELRLNCVVKLKHLNTGLYLHTQPYQSKLEDQHIVSVCKPEIANALWRITDIQ